jgi:hypothetical protein
MDHYIKLFNTSWIEPWMIEAVAMIVGSLVLVFVICKIVDFLNGSQR